jgi:hypothetical protein
VMGGMRRTTTECDKVARGQGECECGRSRGRGNAGMVGVTFPGMI